MPPISKVDLHAAIRRDAADGSGRAAQQRHTAKRIFDRLIDEHDMTEVSYQIVRGYVAIHEAFLRLACALFCYRRLDAS